MQAFCELSSYITPLCFGMQQEYNGGTWQNAIFLRRQVLFSEQVLRIGIREKNAGICVYENFVVPLRRNNSTFMTRRKLVSRKVKSCTVGNQDDVELFFLWTQGSCFRWFTQNTLCIFVAFAVFLAYTTVSFLCRKFISDSSLLMLHNSLILSKLVWLWYGVLLWNINLTCLIMLKLLIAILYFNR